MVCIVRIKAYTRIGKKGTFCANLQRNGLAITQQPNDEEQQYFFCQLRSYQYEYDEQK